MVQELISGTLGTRQKHTLNGTPFYRTHTFRPTGKPSHVNAMFLGGGQRRNLRKFSCTETQ